MKSAKNESLCDTHFREREEIALKDTRQYFNDHFHYVVRESLILRQRKTSTRENEQTKNDRKKKDYP